MDPSKDTEVRHVMLDKEDPIFLTAKFWKRFSVILSIVLSIASLILSAVASLDTSLDNSRLRALTVSGIIINSVSIGISAATSLDWTTQTTADKKFAKQLVAVKHMHGENGHVRIVCGGEDGGENGGGGAEKKTGL